MKDSNECNLQIGEFCCSLRFKDFEYANSVRNYYKGFLSTKVPDLIIDIRIILHHDQINVPDSLIASKKIDGNHFDFHHGLLKGFLMIEDKECNIHVKNALLSGSPVRVFEQFFYQLYYTLLEKKYPATHNNYLLHACAVKRNDQGYVFTGPSGSGKSTIARLSETYQVLNDEMVIIGKKDLKYHVQSTPFNGLFRHKVNKSVPLRAIFYLRHGEKNSIEALRPAKFVNLVMREVAAPIPLLAEFSAKDLIKITDFCEELITEVPCYELYFVPDENIWNFIDESIRE